MAHALNEPGDTRKSTGELPELTPKQLAAVALMAAGRHYTEVATAVGVERKTLWNWRKTAAFSAALNAEMASIREAAQARLLSLANKAFDALERTLAETDNDNARIAAVKLVLERLDVTMPAAAEESEDSSESPGKVYVLEGGPKAAAEELQRRLAAKKVGGQ